MLPLPTEATIETMNGSTDRRYPLHTYNDHSWFRQFEFTQQNVVVNLDDVERVMEISNGKGFWDIDASATINASRRFRYSIGRTIPL